MKQWKLIARAHLMVGLALAGSTQVTDKKSLTMDGARRVIDAAVSQAKRNNTTGVVAVVDDGGNLMALERVDGTFAAGANISIGKARTAALFKKPTKAFEDIIGKGRTSMVALNDFTPLQGGVPIMMEGQVVGAVGVSGAASAQQDEELAMAGAAAIGSAASPVTFFEGAQVKAAFDKGAVLFDKGERYMVHASRREKPGMAEIHTEDADIVYVLEGTATLVTGGAAIDVKTVAPGELRGASIEGGESRQLTKGDVAIVPAGTPHWFKEVSQPFLYYVVKVR
ncbi:MAG: heme-binding protein [Bryobacteraceae bacterium]